MKEKCNFSINGYCQRAIEILSTETTVECNGDHNNKLNCPEWN